MKAFIRVVSDQVGAVNYAWLVKDEIQSYLNDGKYLVMDPMGYGDTTGTELNGSGGYIKRCASEARDLARFDGYGNPRAEIYQIQSRHLWRITLDKNGTITSRKKADEIWEKPIK